MTVPIRVLIVDDETPARRRLIQFLEPEPDLVLAGEAANGLEAVKAVEELAPDLVFLDVQMPELDGFGVVDAVGVERMPATLFVTAYDSYALEAFESNAIDYLLKPFDKDRFRKALTRARTWLGRGPSSGMPEELRTVLHKLAESRSYPERLMVRSGECRQLIHVNDLQWVEAESNYVRLHAVGGSFLMRESMRGIESKLDPKRFRRIHRSSIVNLDHIQQLQPWFGGDYAVLMRDGSRLTLSRTYKGNLKDLL